MDLHVFWLGIFWCGFFWLNWIIFVGCVSLIFFFFWGILMLFEFYKSRKWTYENSWSFVFISFLLVVRWSFGYWRINLIQDFTDNWSFIYLFIFFTFCPFLFWIFACWSFFFPIWRDWFLIYGYGLFTFFLSFLAEVRVDKLLVIQGKKKKNGQTSLRWIWFEHVYFPEILN